MKRVLIALVMVVGLSACNRGGADELVVYSGRNENLIRPLLEKFAADSGIDIRVRYAETAEMLPTLLEEGTGTRADIFISQDAGALGELTERGFLRPLPKEILDQVDADHRDGGGHWVGLTGRTRVIAYNTEHVRPGDVPATFAEVNGPHWKGRVGIAPTNASFVAHMSAIRTAYGDDTVRSFLGGLKANGVKTYDNNVLVVEALARGEIDLGLVNNYYVLNKKKETPDAPVANAVPTGEPTFLNLTGAGVLVNAKHRTSAFALVEYLLSKRGQTYFRDQTNEYPVSAGVQPPAGLTPLRDLKLLDVPFVTLGEDLESTTRMIEEAGLR